MAMLLTWILIVVLIIVLIPTLYLVVLALASIYNAPPIATVFRQPGLRFMIAIPAHNEASVIERTVKRMRSLNYPPELFDVHIVADFCTDETASLARNAGAIVHERNQGPRTGKGAALSWLFQKALKESGYDAVIIFDADTLVEPNFLRIMEARLDQGYQVVQGQHKIINPDQGWFPALTWAMFLVDNRYQNLGRANLGWSAKNMGDSICLRTEVLRKVGWGSGLTEDYHLRQKLLLEGIRIHYEPTALGLGEAPLTWLQARAQRARWLKGTRESSRQFANQLLAQGFKTRNMALLDGALQAYFPSYSTLTLLSVFVLCLLLFINLFVRAIFPYGLIQIWGILVVLLFLYPLFGLALERAPVKAYLVMLTGPLFIFWRTWLAFRSRFSRKPVTWVRTAHGERK